MTVYFQIDKTQTGKLLSFSTDLVSNKSYCSVAIGKMEEIKNIDGTTTGVFVQSSGKNIEVSYLLQTEDLIKDIIKAIKKGEV